MTDHLGPFDDPRAKALRAVRGYCEQSLDDQAAEEMAGQIIDTIEDAQVGFVLVRRPAAQWAAELRASVYGSEVEE